jgi:hypothetical protein
MMPIALAEGTNHNRAGKSMSARRLRPASAISGKPDGKRFDKLNISVTLYCLWEERRFGAESPGFFIKASAWGLGLAWKG